MHPKIQPWHLIVLGIALTISAALIQHLYVEQKYQELADIRTNIANLDNRIEGLWQQNIEAERKKEFAALLIDSSQFQLNAVSFLENYIKSIVPDADLPSTPEAKTLVGLKHISEHQALLRHQIDELYFEHISLSQQAAPIEKQISQTKNIALLMQLLGLILVLSKDLANRTPPTKD